MAEELTDAMRADSPIEYAFFHWEVEYPAGLRASRGGFDVVLGNPPWEHVKLHEKEFFAAPSRDRTARERCSKKEAYRRTRDETIRRSTSVAAALRKAEGDEPPRRVAGRYPLCGRGEVNTYAVFAELMRSLIGHGPRGLHRPDRDRDRRHHTVLLPRSRRAQVLVSLFGFENEEFIFSGDPHTQRKFCLLTLSGRRRPARRCRFRFFFAQRCQRLD